MLYLSLGSNLGDREANLRTAVRMISERIGHVSATSDIIETEPAGFDSPNRFLNQAIGVETSLTPETVLELTQAIEKEIGRKEKSHNGIYKDRIIDIDLLMYNGLIINTDLLTLPHPQMEYRWFVLEPLAQIAPDEFHPVAGKNIRTMADNYLEKHYEEYLKRKAIWEKTHKTTDNKPKKNEDNEN